MAGIEANAASALPTENEAGFEPSSPNPKRQCMSLVTTTQKSQITGQAFVAPHSALELSDSIDEVVSNSRESFTNEGIIPLSKHLRLNNKERCYASLRPGECPNGEVMCASLMELAVGSCYVFGIQYPFSECARIVPEIANKARLLAFLVYDEILEHWTIVIADRKMAKAFHYDSMACKGYSKIVKQLIHKNILCKEHRIESKTWEWEDSVGLPLGT